MGSKNPTCCHDCGVQEGELHQFGCDMEVCPFCGRQLISRGCVYRELHLEDSSRWSTETAHLPPSVYQEGLSQEQERLWLEMLTARGRFPYILWPTICARCGALWPELFMVPDGEWEHYIDPQHRGCVVCRDCYQGIKDAVSQRG